MKWKDWIIDSTNQRKMEIPKSEELKYGGLHCICAWRWLIYHKKGCWLIFLPLDTSFYIKKKSNNHIDLGKDLLVKVLME